MIEQSYEIKCPHYFNGNIKKNKFIALAMMDSENNMYKETTDGFEFAVKIDEYIDRIKELAYGCIVIIDEKFLESNDYLPVTDKTTVVLCENIKQTSMKVEYKYRRNMDFIRTRDFYKYVVSHETSRRTPLFFALTTDYLELLRYSIDVFEFAQSDKEFGGNLPYATHYFNWMRRKNTFQTATSKEYELKQKEADKSEDGKRIVEYKGNFKITKKIDTSSILGYNYVFRRFER